MAFRICDDNTINSNGTGTHLQVKQTTEGTVVFSIVGSSYQEHKMPHNRYNVLDSDDFDSKAASKEQFDADISALVDCFMD